MAQPTPTLDLAMEAGMLLPVDYLADFIFPAVRAVGATRNQDANTYSAQHSVIEPSNFQGARDVELSRSRGAATTREKLQFSTATIEANEQNTEIEFEQEDLRAENLTAQGLRMMESEIIAPALESRLNIKREIVAATLAAMFSNGKSAAPGEHWDEDYNPIDDFFDAFDSVHTKSFKRPNKVGFSLPYYRVLQQNTNFRSLLPEQLNNLTVDALSEIVASALMTVSGEFKNLIDSGDFKVRVGTASRNTANAGQTASMSRIVSTGCWVFYGMDPAMGNSPEAQRMALKKLTAGRSIIGRGLEGRVYREDTTKLVIYEQSHFIKPVIASQSCCYYMSSMLSTE